MKTAPIEILNQFLAGKILVTYEYWTEIEGFYRLASIYFSKSEEHCNMGFDEKIVRHPIMRVSISNDEEIRRNRTDFTIITEKGRRWPLSFYDYIEIEEKPKSFSFETEFEVDRSEVEKMKKSVKHCKKCGQLIFKP